MSSIQLLDKTRKINKLLHNNNSQKVVFNDICKVLTEVMNSNVLVISKKGKILGKNEADHIEVLHQLISGNVKDYVDFSLNERLLTILSTNENVSLSTLGFESDVDDYYAIIAPIDIAGERFGTLFMYRQRENYSIDDIILAEYGTTVVGLEMLRSVSEEVEQERRKKGIVDSAISTLSLEGNEGVLVASKIADRFGITRSVVVNALRKLESAGVVETRSSGMKGTYIKVVNDFIFDEITKLD
mgnify:CR=1 FL=1